MESITLGLDLGTSSIGWALLGAGETKVSSKLIACGSRIFHEALDAKTKAPKNQARRDARSARKLVARRKMRKETLLNLLVKSGLLPEDKESRDLLLVDNKQFEPYRLRKHGLDERLSLFELGRIMYHINLRRGFQSNRKARSKDDGEVNSRIKSLSKEIAASGSRTLGEYLDAQAKKRDRNTDRSMYKEEFELIWKKQQEHYNSLLTPVLKVVIHKSIFFQRPLKLQKNLVGKCTFEPSRKRAARALLEAQRFRMLQDINHLAIKNPVTRELRLLDTDERQTLLTLLEKQKSVSWTKARKTLGLHEGEVFNLEEGKKKELIGNRTSYALRSILGKRWDEMTQNERGALITDMLTIDNESSFLKRMAGHWGFGQETAEELAKTEFEPGYARLSRKAICNILPHLEQGLAYDKACLAAGYDHSKPGSAVFSKRLEEPPHLRNPVVQKALYEVRKIINAIIRVHGKPSVIRVEMARDMKLTRRQKQELQKKQNSLEKANDNAREILRNDFGRPEPSMADIKKYQMWMECLLCPYTGTAISKEMLFSPEVDVEHIIPYSRSLDDSYMNKTLCMAEENRKIKRNKTPYEAYHADEARYLEILQRIKNLPYPKRRRFEQKEVDTEEFIERQLNDTRYICVEVKKYLQQLGSKVEISKGEATAALRHRWNLNRILSEDDGSGKNRNDHRHHAVDAIVIALTSRSLFQRLSKLSAQSGAGLSERGFSLDLPWPSFYEDVQEKVKNIIVSHALSRKIAGALHEETAYGYSEHEKLFAYRKPLSDLKAGMVEKIRDKKVRDLVKARIAQCEGDLKKAFGNQSLPLTHVDGKTPINSVRLAVAFDQKTVFPVKGKGNRPYKFFTYGNNHHVEIVEDLETGKRQAVFVSMMEAARRARIEKKTIVQRDHGLKYRFIMSLCPDDMVEIGKDGEKRFYRVQKMSSGKQIEVMLKRPHDAMPDYNKNSLALKSPDATKKIIRKISIDILGNILSCND